MLDDVFKSIAQVTGQMVHTIVVQRKTSRRSLLTWADDLEKIAARLREMAA